MRKTSNVFARVEPELKDKAEFVLNELGIPMSNAISIFLKQVVLQKGLPFEVKLPDTAVPSYDALNKEQFNAVMEEAFTDYRAGRHQDADEAFSEIEHELKICPIK